MTGIKIQIGYRRKNLDKKYVHEKQKCTAMQNTEG